MYRGWCKVKGGKESEEIGAARPAFMQYSAKKTTRGKFQGRSQGIINGTYKGGTSSGMPSNGSVPDIESTAKGKARIIWLLRDYGRMH